MSATGAWHVADAEMARFCAQFATLLAADVKLMPALVTSRQQSTNELMGEVLLEVQTDLEGGLTLAAAFARQPDVFSPFAIQLVRQGELEGRLAEAFHTLAEHYRGASTERAATAGGGSIAIDASMLTEAIRPFAVTILIALGVVGVLSALVLILQEQGVLPEGLSGPTILLITALVVLLAAVLLRGSRPASAHVPSQAPLPLEASVAITAPARAAVRPRVRSDASYLERDPNEPVDLDLDA